jgi:DNA adenine methylase
MDSPLCYIGGKSQLSRQIIEKIPSHSTYVECFSGAAWVFFRKIPSKYEVINDKDGDLVSFYRVLQNHFEEFIKQFKWLVMSRQWWTEWNNQLGTGGLTDIQRAARYYYVQRQCFGGKVRGRTFGTQTEHAPRINLIRMEEELSDVHFRLSKVMIENLDYKDLVNRYDKPESFFYLDPPYYKAPFYMYNMELPDFVTMVELLKKVTGKFMLSINDHPDIVEIFKDFIIEKVDVNYSVQSSGDCIGKELIIRNYDNFERVEPQMLDL